MHFILGSMLLGNIVRHLSDLVVAMDGRAGGVDGQLQLVNQHYKWYQRRSRY